ncbi:hypothetical protein GCM10009789_20110 [Kribbella sancticallisti]|uniref:TPM domain-containing protein n=1 Tax=Kribbella sancticallisti TaxID=460087 RepID=A0ABP4NX26_9ACTN
MRSAGRGMWPGTSTPRRLTVLLLAAIGLLVCAPATAWSIPTDPRVAAAVEAWKDQPVYVDPQYAVTVNDEQVRAMVERIGRSDTRVFVAVVPSGAWFQEKGDTAMLAGWLATANGKPGIYLVMDGGTTTGVDHLVRAYSPRSTYGGSRESMEQQLSKYLEGVRLNDRYEAEPARTEPLPPREERTYTPERFTVGKAIGNGVGGVFFGLFGGAVLAGCVLGLAALVARRGGGRL